MALKAGIVGLPNVGKSTLFNALSNSQVEAANYPFATIKPNVGTVELPDKRVSNLAALVQPQKVIRSTFEFIDIAGLVEGASQGEGLGNKFLASIREVDAIIMVVRCFDDANVLHINNQVNPVSDATIVNTELILADLEVIGNILHRTTRKLKVRTDKTAALEHELALRAKEHLEAEKPLRVLAFTTKEKRVTKSWNLLTSKPLIYVGNVSEAIALDPTRSCHFRELASYAEANNEKVLAISARLEVELSQISDGITKQQFLDELGLTETGLSKLVQTTFGLLGLATFFTVGKAEVRSWTFRTGTQAPQCAGLIHSDFERGFIKVEVITYKDYIRFGSEPAVRQAGKLRLEGKDYVVQDGDVLDFKFNV